MKKDIIKDGSGKNIGIIKAYFFVGINTRKQLLSENIC